MTTTARLIALLTCALLTTAACADRTAGPAEGAAGAGGPETVLLLGDSVAEGLALPLGAALDAAGAGFESLAADGGGNVVGPFADRHWPELPGRIAAAAPTVVVYQVTTYDWGTPQEQRDAYQRLADTVSGTGAVLALVTAPPIRPDDFYAPHMGELAATRDAVLSVADGSGGRVVALDAETVWGPAYQQTRDGLPDRSADGIHACQQGAARFATWLVEKLAVVRPGIVPAAPEQWANAGWSADPRFTGC
ncbi:SGNH/GDSL hydrolase family protein [Pseudonocardia sp. HH130630-07]|uniref:SGNH/GDSL hydrolase family protein n=1 Tax=Pseudonocardia sp. HH130630-07 TaxID=1690815 RepID=UPI0012E9C3D2|nr:SGNH/GDSL hydrolase family protein [Pseudonocardia sp. HH130630-07]